MEAEAETKPISPREALATLSDWLAGGDVQSGWGGPLSARSERDYGERAPSYPADSAAGTSPISVPDAALDGGATRRAPSGSRAALPIDLEADRAEVDACRACRLGEGRRHAAYGEGVASPLVLVVGEGPGAEEDAQGRPFVGPAGQLLDKMLGSVGLSRTTNCYIANIVKCRPPGNREPAPDEREACMPWLERQIEALHPAFILAMGRTAATSLLGTAEGIGKLRGRWFERGGIPLLATYHPSALLRDETLKRPAWEDLKMLKFRLGEAERPSAPAPADAAAASAGTAPPASSVSPATDRE